MDFRARVRPLYLLALFQLVAGPLVLFQVTVLCKLAIRDAPQHGVTAALAMAWHTPEFQSTLSLADRTGHATSESQLPASDPKADPVKAKMPLVAWQAARLVLVNPARRTAWQDIPRMWTPALPLPPPGPPPRIG